MAEAAGAAALNPADAPGIIGPGGEAGFLLSLLLLIVEKRKRLCNLTLNPAGNVAPLVHKRKVEKVEMLLALNGITRHYPRRQQLKDLMMSILWIIMLPSIASSRIRPYQKKIPDCHRQCQSIPLIMNDCRAIAAATVACRMAHYGHCRTERRCVCEDI